jgi:EpsI family protein
MSWALRWAPVVTLAVGGALLFGAGQQHTPQLRAPLASALPTDLDGLFGTDVTVSPDEAAVAGFTDYALRTYGPAPGGQVAAEAAEGDPQETWVSLYVGFYEEQTRGKTIHSPKNCLPGAGWEPLSSEPYTLRVAGGDVTVNRYVLQNGDAQALVLYWYQGRGRVAYHEYGVKWDLLRDAVVRRRTDEALVRLVIPITESESAALEIARGIASELVVSVGAVLPA